MDNQSFIDQTALMEAVALGRAGNSPITTEKIHIAVLPKDAQLVSLKDYQYPFGVPPERIRATVALRDTASFLKYVKDYRKDSKTLTFAEPTRFSFLSVLDYHPRGDGDMAPEFCDHKASFTLTQDERWKIWNAMDNKPFTQEAFAEFIEDNRADILSPSPAAMLEIAQDLSAHTEVNFGSSTKLSNGQVQLRYEETVKAGVPSAGNIEVPTEFSIQVPVFYGEAPETIPVRLRFRIATGKLSFHYKLYRPVETQNRSFERVVASIGEGLGEAVLLGNPA